MFNGGDRRLHKVSIENFRQVVVERTLEFEDPADQDPGAAIVTSGGLEQLGSRSPKFMIPIYGENRIGRETCFENFLLYMR